MKLLQMMMPVISILVFGACDKNSGVAAPAKAPVQISNEGSLFCSAQQTADLRELQLICQKPGNAEACQESTRIFKNKYANTMDCRDDAPTTNGTSIKFESRHSDFPACPQQVIDDMKIEEQKCDQSQDIDSPTCIAATNAFNMKYSGYNCEGQIGDLHFIICDSTQSDCAD